MHFWRGARGHSGMNVHLWWCVCVYTGYYLLLVYRIQIKILTLLIPTYLETKKGSIHPLLLLLSLFCKKKEIMFTLVALNVHILLCRQSSISFTAIMMHYASHEISKEYRPIRWHLFYLMHSSLKEEDALSDCQCLLCCHNDCAEENSDRIIKYIWVNKIILLVCHISIEW